MQRATFVSLLLLFCSTFNSADRELPYLNGSLVQTYSHGILATSTPVVSNPVFKLTDLFPNVSSLWSSGITGKGIRIAVFDTGLHGAHPNFRYVLGRSSFSEESQREDKVGHGTAVCSVVASSSKFCPGLATDAFMLSARVFDRNGITRTSWLLKAFNWAEANGAHIIVLSLGGADFHDKPFVDKVRQVSAKGVILVSAVGNDGPSYGTHNNPADQLEVLGVGAVDASSTDAASFSARGMTLWDLPLGMGHVKSDLVTFGTNILVATQFGSCRAVSGTSFSAPIVAGAVALIGQKLSHLDRFQYFNPASVKQLLIESASRLLNSPIVAQGSGSLNLTNALIAVDTFRPHVSAFPYRVDWTDPYFEPFILQSLFYDALPIYLNFTLLNSACVESRITSRPQFVSSDSSDFLDINFSYRERLWPWSGFLAVQLSVNDLGRSFQGLVRGNISLVISCDSESFPLSIELVIRVIPTPPRSKRLLWDQFHSLRYPNAFHPSDSVAARRSKVPFDWTGDHPFTNFINWYRDLIRRGFTLELLSSPFNCFNASKYSVLILPDPERPFSFSEIVKFKKDLVYEGLSVIILAEWFHPKSSERLSFYDQSTRRLWKPILGGGANIPSLNQLLTPFGAAFDEQILRGRILIPGYRWFPFDLGTGIRSLPNGSLMLNILLENDFASETVVNASVLGFFKAEPNRLGSGRMILYGDSSCVDSTSLTENYCFDFMASLLEYAITGELDPRLGKVVVPVINNVHVQDFLPLEGDGTASLDSIVCSSFKEIIPPLSTNNVDVSVPAEEEFHETRRHTSCSVPLAVTLLLSVAVYLSWQAGAFRREKVHEM